MQHYDAESMRIQREFGQKLPNPDSTEQKQAWAKSLQSAMALAAKNAEACVAQANKATQPQRMAAQQGCAEQSHRAAEELARRYRGRTLTTAEQAAYRDEETQLLDARQACMVRALQAGKP